MAQMGSLRETLTLKKEEEGACVRVCVRAQCKAASETARARDAALIHLMKQRAVQHCKDQQKAYADCVRGRTVSVVRPYAPCAAAARVLTPARAPGLGLPRVRGRNERLPQARASRRLRCALRHKPCAEAGLSRRGGASSQYTDEAALQALKAKWLKAGKPNLANTCVPCRAVLWRARACGTLRALTRPARLRRSRQQTSPDL